MAESNVVSALESTLEYGLQVLFDNWDEDAMRLGLNHGEILEQLEWSLSDFDLLTEYKSHIREVWDNE